MLVKVIPLRRMPLRLSVLDYSVAKECENDIKIGQLIKIPLKNQEVFGVVYDIVQDNAESKLKEIEKVILDDVLSVAQLQFLKEMSEFYHCSLGFLAKNNVMPLQSRKISKIDNSNTKERHRTINIKTKKPVVYSYLDEQEKNDYLVNNINPKKQNLILVPEMNDLKDVTLNAELDKHTIYVDSNLSTKDFFQIWIDVWSGKKNIVIGTRRALFLPWTNLSNIFLLNEGNSNHKSWDMAPRFHTRDASMMLAKHHGSRLHLLDHTLSVESYFFGKNKVYDSKKLIADDKQKQQVEIVDMVKEKQSRNYGFLSGKVVDALKETVKGDVFIFLNRRGSASYVGCRDCGIVSKCSDCNNLLTFHQDTGMLKCHYCKQEKKMSKHCPNCNGINISMYGVGTQMVENEIIKMFGHDKEVEVVRIDSDGDVDCKFVVGDMNKRKIIIGTQMAWSCIKWDKLSCVVFLDADTSLFVPEYKVSENLWYLIQDVKYRISDEARLLIQTGHADHFVFTNIFNKINFYNTELQQRKIFSYPPYKFLLKLFIKDNYKDKIEKHSALIKDKLTTLIQHNSGISVIGPLESLPYRYNNQYCQIILAKIDYSGYKRDIKNILNNLGDDWRVDPNPNSVLII